MKIENIEEARRECERFIKAATALLLAEYAKKEDWHTNPKQSGACRRASMDLTRTLAKMRQDK